MCMTFIIVEPRTSTHFLSENMAQKAPRKRLWTVPHDRFSIRILRDIVRRTNRMSRKLKMSRNECIEQALAEWLSRQEQDIAKAA